MLNRWLSGVGVVVAALAALAVAASPATADEAASVYDPTTVGVIDLQLLPAAVVALETEPEEYVEGTFSFAPSDGTPAGIGSFSTPIKVEARLKGSASFRDFDEKAAFKLKFGKAAPFLGLRKMTLNNMVEDPSMIHETLAYPSFRAAAVPAPRTGFAYLKINGEDFGVYLNVETLDNVWAAKQFGAFDSDSQHLYEGENGADLKPGAATAFEVDEGDDADIADLEALIAAVNASPPPDWTTRVSPVADLGEMTRMWAVEKLVGQWDGYAGAGRTSFQPNNYYLYSDPLGRFQMLPWGTDDTFNEEGIVGFDERSGLMFGKCLDDAACAETFWHSLSAANGAIANLGLDARATQAASLLAPWQQLEQGNSRHEYSLEQIAAGVAETREFIADRPGEAEAWLAAHVPPAHAVSAATTAATAALPVAVGKHIHVGRTWSTEGALRTRLRLLSSGVITQRVQILSEEGRLGVCRARIGVGVPRRITLPCVFSAAARQSLRERSLRATVVTRFLASDDTMETVTRTVTVPRA